MSADGSPHRGQGGHRGHADDFVQSFRIQGTPVGGRIVRLGASIDAILTPHAYPSPVSRLVGEAIALLALIGGGMKFEGRLTLQSRSEGPVTMMVADYLTRGEIRACATFDANAVARLDRTTSIKDLLGKGRLAISIDQGARKETYQGIVALEGDSLADCAREYLHRSEQVESYVKLAVAEIVDARGQRSWRAGGLMIQHLPHDGASFLDENGEPFSRSVDDPWQRAQILAHSAEDHELVDPTIGSEELLFWLFHEDGVRVTPPHPIAFGCTCTEGRVRRILESYTQDDYKTMLEEGKVRVRCEFCSRTYRFSPEELSKPREDLS